MKTNFFKWLLLLSVLVLLSSCDSKMIKKQRLTVNPNPLTLTSEAQTQYVKTTNLLDIQPLNEIDIVEDGVCVKNEWIEIKYSGSNRIAVSVTENTTPNNRTYKLRLNSYNESDMLNVTQNGKTN